jgi:hypothetical protein
VEAAGNSPAASAEKQYQLQYQHNNGPWQLMPAENFPQPEKVLKLDFNASQGSDLNNAWQFLTGNASSATITDDGNDTFLHLGSGAEATIALGRYETLWDPAEYAVDIRLPAGEQSGAGLIFGYVDEQNYNRVELNTDGIVSVERVVSGAAIRIAQGVTNIDFDRWNEVKIVLEENQAIVDYNDGALELTAAFDAAIPASVLGLFVPAQSTAEFDNLVIEGAPRSPRISIMASNTFQHGAPTVNLLAGSDSEFSGGSGVSFGDTTRPWTQSSGHSEWEWPVVIRRFADGAETNNNGDRFGFRMVTADGEPLASTANPVVTVAVPPRHLGGVFVETPARIGPFAANNGDLYFLMEPAETDNMLMAVKSTDGGQSWQEVDGANRPATGDLEGFAAAQADGIIYMLHQTSNDVLLHALLTSDHATQPDSWTIQDERLASPEEPPTQVADIAIRSDGSLVGVYGGPQKIHVKIRSPDGLWGDEIVIDNDEPQNLSGPSLITGLDDVVHLAYTGDDGSAWYRRIQPDGNRVQVLFIDEESRHIFHTYANDNGEWQTATLQVGEINAQWVRGARLRGDGTERVYGYVYDAGADGGSGKNRYREVPLADLP